VLLILLCYLILTQVWWDLQVTNFTGLHPLHGEIGEGLQSVSIIFEWIWIGWLLLGKSVPACVDSFWIATSCSWMVWLERVIVASCCFAGSWWIVDHLCVGRRFIRHSRVSQSFCWLTWDCGLKRVINACCHCWRELIVRDPIRVDDRFIRQTLDLCLIVRIV